MNKGGIITFGIGLTIVCFGLLWIDLNTILVIAGGTLISFLGIAKVGFEEYRKGERWKAGVSSVIATLLGAVFFYLATVLGEIYN